MTTSRSWAPAAASAPPPPASGRDVVRTIGAGIRRGYGHVVGTPSTPAWVG